MFYFHGIRKQKTFLRSALLEKIGLSTRLGEHTDTICNIQYSRSGIVSAAFWSTCFWQTKMAELSDWLRSISSTNSDGILEKKDGKYIQHP